MIGLIFKSCRINNSNGPQSNFVYVICSVNCLVGVIVGYAISASYAFDGYFRVIGSYKCFTFRLKVDVCFIDP